MALSLFPAHISYCQPWHSRSPMQRRLVRLYRMTSFSSSTGPQLPTPPETVV
jgi:hypothetical protein